MNNEVKRRIKSIVEVLVFLVVMTFYWYGPRQNVADMATNVGGFLNKTVTVEANKELSLDNNEVVFTVSNKSKEEQNYEIIINSDYRKQRVNRCILVSNNYLKYSLNTEDLSLENKNLSVDGIIYRGVLKPSETKQFNIKMSIDKENVSPDECYYPVIKAASYKKI